MKSILLLTLVIAAADPSSCTTNVNPVPQSPENFRFEKTYSETVGSTVYEVVRDRKSGAEFFWMREGDASGLVMLPQR